MTDEDVLRALKIQALLEPGKWASTAAVARELDAGPEVVYGRLDHLERERRVKRWRPWSSKHRTLTLWQPR